MATKRAKKAKKKFKGKSIFDVVTDLTLNKVRWEDQTESTRKSFSPFMVNKIISMHQDFIEIVNYIQQFNMSGMSSRDAYRLYFDLLPKQRIWSKYIKAKTSSDDKINQNLIEFLSERECWSTDEARENISLLLNSIPTGEFTTLFSKYLSAHGISSSEANKKYGIKV